MASLGNRQRQLSIDFRHLCKLSSDGIAGPNTWGALCTSFSSTKKKDVVTLGSRGGEVRLLQHFLSKQGFGPGLIDGIFGDSTRNSVMQFQKRSGLFPNGIVESATWTKLLQSKSLLGSQAARKTCGQYVEWRQSKFGWRYSS